jgi:hypothetical protein
MGHHSHSVHVQPAAAAFRNRVERAGYLKPEPLARPWFLVRVPRLRKMAASFALREIA